VDVFAVRPKQAIVSPVHKSPLRRWCGLDTVRRLSSFPSLFGIRSKPSARVFCGTFVAFVAFASAQQRAWAADSPSAEALIRRGVELRKAGNDQAALREFRKAHELAGTPRSAGQLGLCEQALGDWASAQRHLSQALAATGDAWVRKNRTVLERSLALANNHTGRVEIFGAPEGAEVIVNGRSVGKLPLGEPVVVNVGAVDVEVRAPGYRSGSASAQVAAAQMATVVLRLESADAGRTATAAPPVEPPKPVVTPPVATASPPAAVDLTARSEPRPAGAPIYRKPLFWVVVSAAVVAAAVVGVVLATKGVDYPDVQGRGTFSNPGGP